MSLKNFFEIYDLKIWFYLLIIFYEFTRCLIKLVVVDSCVLRNSFSRRFFANWRPKYDERFSRIRRKDKYFANIDPSMDAGKILEGEML